MSAVDAVAVLAELARAVGIDTEAATHDELVSALRLLVERRVPPLELLRAAMPEIVSAVLSVEAAPALRVVQHEQLAQAELELARRLRTDALLAGRLPAA